ncbi:enoyl-ACP reductase FabI [Streptomyces sp. NPDC051940]|uniref:enoyl-ACP reductase FabI n=1 Tax=Streptomyces sp. NPDC051940 TaxID=3155675 RepID=UPI00342533E7
MSGLLAGRTILVAGVLNEHSLAYAAARAVEEHGGRTVLTCFQRPGLVARAAARLVSKPPVIPLDVTDERDLAALADRLRPHTDRLDGVVHAVGWAPRPCDYPGFARADWAHAGPVLRVSAHSLAALTTAALPLMPGPGSVVGLDFDSSRAWPGYDWMGVAKAALAATARYLAAELGPRGIRVNLVSCGPVRTVSAHGEPHFGEIAGEWTARAPLGWDVRDPAPVGDACVALLSDLLASTTGTVIHVDGGAHAVGMRSGDSGG